MNGGLQTFPGVIFRGNERPVFARRELRWSPALRLLATRLLWPGDGKVRAFPIDNLWNFKVTANVSCGWPHCSIVTGR